VVKVAEKNNSEEQAKKYKLIKPLHYKGKLIDPEEVENAEVELYLDQAENLRKQGVIT